MAPVSYIPEEIWRMIANYLKIKSLYACVLVSRCFKSTFTPLLWRDVSWHAGSPKCHLSYLKIYASLVERLTINRYLPKGFGYIKFQRLKSLSLVNMSEDVNDSTTGSCINLPVSLAVHINLNPHIKFLDASFADKELSNRFWKVVATVWKDPISLSIKYSKPISGIPKLITSSTEATAKAKSPSPQAIPSRNFEYSSYPDYQDEPVEGPYFWQACSQFQELSLDMPEVPYLEILESTSLQRVERLTLSRTWQGFHATTQASNIWCRNEFEVVRACPRLQYLRWDLIKSGFPTVAISKELRGSRWPCLDSLVFCNVHLLSDAKLKEVLYLLPNPLKQFELHNNSSSATVGPLSFEGLKIRHFETLERLSVKGCALFTSKMAHDVLMECSKLRYFAADYIMMEDIVQYEAPWICSSTLEELHIFMIYQNRNQSHLHSQALEKIGKLERLEKLVLSMDLYNIPSYPDYTHNPLRRGQSLILRLDTGLGQLEKLKRLRYLGVDSANQELEINDVEWMGDHWRSLETVSGKLSQNQGTHEYMVEVLKGYGVECPVQTFREEGVTSKRSAYRFFY